MHVKVEFVNACAMLGKFLLQVRRYFISSYVLNSAIWNLLVSGQLLSSIESAYHRDV